jgi:PAS domain S-box-containing protein
MDSHPWPKKRRSKDAEEDEAEVIPPILPEPKGWYQDLLEHSHDLCCIHDLQGRILSVNVAAARVLEYSVEEMLRLSLREVIAPDFRAEVDTYLKQIESAREAHGWMTVITRRGERRIWEYYCALRTEGVRLPMVRCIGHDVTERKQTERRLREVSESLLDRVRESERTIRELKLFRTLVDQSNDSIKVIDRETLHFLDVNEKACSELGYSREELLSMGVFDIDPVVTEASAANVLEELRRSGSLVMESVHRRKDGITFPVELSMRRVQLDRVYIIAISRDLTERKQAEARLQASENRYRILHERAPVGISWTDRTGHFLGVNPKFCEIAGRTEHDLLERDFPSITHPDDLAENLEKLRQIREGEKLHYEMEKRYIRPDGSVRWGKVDVVRMWPEADSPDWYMAIVQDITERKQAEEALRTSERQQHKIAKQLETERARLIEAQAVAKVGSWETELPSLEITWSEQTHRIFETDPSYFHPSRPDFVKLIHPEDRTKVDAAFEASLEKGVPSKVEYRIVMADGRVKVLEERWKVFRDEEGRPVRLVGTCSDVTERKQAEEALRQSEQRFRVALEGSPTTVFSQDRDLRYTWVYNPQEGMSEEDILGKTDEELFGPEIADRMTAVKRQVLETGKGLRRESSMTVRGKTKYCDLTYEPLRDAAGSVVGLTCACISVTHLREITEELRVAKEKLSEEKLYLEQAIDSELGFGEIIGRSGALKEVMEKVSKVAPSNATVLLLGETGTGKELVARALHRLSKRSTKTFIKVNCAAIPSGLLESELFGHEKGAFTGAVSRKIGRLELADQGTLFLDEVGEIPLGLQPKLLRVLQDQEFERLGSTQTINVNFRLLAATNRNLPQSVKDGDFRSDLFYRLNVFPIVIPPLRDRREDVQVLVEHFVRYYASRMNKSIASIPSKTMEALVQWEWPGNIRELENFVERSVILTPGSVLQAPLGELRGGGGERDTGTLRDREREKIIRVLRECRGRLGGPNGAAARLGLKRTTLQSRLSQLGIKPDSYRKSGM